jgi:ribosome-associated translation inhibitor RaiA
MSATTETSGMLEYKGRPLRRKDNLIYYGSMSDKYIIMMQITETKKVKDMDVATKVGVQLQLTDPDLKSRDRVVKKTEKSNLYAAIDVAAVWLERALSSN